jgi:hypothetical protein
MITTTEDKILFDLYSVERRQFVAKYHAYTAGEIANELHRGHTWSARQILYQWM